MTPRVRYVRRLAAAYPIFHDATVRHIAAQSPAKLATISDVGKARLAMYG